MPSSERAKQLAAQQKAAVQAEKLRKKTSDDPKDWGRGRQFIQAFKLTQQYDKPLVWLMIGSFIVVVAIFFVISRFLNPWWMFVIFGVLFGLLAAMYVLSWRAKIAMFKRYAGQPGAGEVGLNLLPKTWVKNPAIAVDRYQNVIHRAIGPAGIVLVGDGQAGRVREMLATEAKRHEAIKYNVPVTTIVMGDAANQVPLNKLDKYIKKLPKTIKPSQVTEITARLKALDGARPRLPIPKGPMPSMKGARSALRGR
jgi:F0F1-type ATP synthase assembly protein I